MKNNISVLSSFRQVVPLFINKEQLDQQVSVPEALPEALYLHVDGNVEWSVFNGHAWGRASVSSDPAGNSPYPVARLRLRIIMNTPQQQNSTTGSDNASMHDNDVVWAGANPILSGPHTTFDAYAEDPRYGSWSNSGSVY